MIYEYFSKAQEKLREIGSLIKDVNVEFRTVSPEMGIVRGRIMFIEGSILDFRELVSTKDHDYRFQWMKADKRLISRWDNAPHYKKLKNFPFHQHLEKKKVIAAKEVDFIWLLDEIKSKILKELLEKRIKI